MREPSWGRMAMRLGEINNTAVKSEAAEVDPQELLQELKRTPMPHDPPVDRIPFGQPMALSECPVCENTTGIPRYAIRNTEFRLVDCENCGLGRLHPEPTPEAIRSFYPAEYYGTPSAKFSAGTERMVRYLAGRTAKRLARHLPPGSRVLDVGCGRGVLLSTLADQGLETHGFEISAAAAEGADPRAKIEVGASLLDAQYPDDCFDLVVLCHVLEHLPNPKEILEEIERILKPGGRLAVSVPNYSSWQALLTEEDWFHLDLPRHLHHFPAAALRQILYRTGFVCRSEEHFSLAQNPFGWVQSLLNRYSTGTKNSLYTQLKRRPGSESAASGNFLLKLLYAWGMPAGLVLSLLSAGVRRGATITVIAEAGSPIAPTCDASIDSYELTPA